MELVVGVAADVAVDFVDVIAVAVAEVAVVDLIDVAADGVNGGDAPIMGGGG